jgi:hypothetical protein
MTTARYRRTGSVIAATGAYRPGLEPGDLPVKQPARSPDHQSADGSRAQINLLRADRPRGRAIVSVAMSEVAKPTSTGRRQRHL